MTTTAESGSEREAVLERLAAAREAAEFGTGLAELTLQLALLTRPQVALDRYRAHLAELAADVATAAAGSLDGAANALSDTLARQHGYAGDRLTYDDLQNANLIRVIDRRKGLPVALGILYIHAARAQGWEMSGLNFPGHFLVRLEVGGERTILDPFNEGAPCSPAMLRGLLKGTQGDAAELTPEHYEPVSDRAVLLRLQNNIKLRMIQLGQAADAVGIVEAMLVFAPDQVPLWRESGLLHAHLGNVRAAVGALERYLEAAEAGRARHEAAALLQRLRNQLN